MSQVALYFKNVSDEDFTGYWDSVAYTIKSGQEVLLQSYIAISLAKDLAMREIGKRDRQATINPSQDETGFFTNEVFRSEVQKYISSESIQEETPEKLEMAILSEQKQFCKFCDSKGVRHKKDCPTLKKEEEFPDLKNN